MRVLHVGVEQVLSAGGYPSDRIDSPVCDTSKSSHVLKNVRSSVRPGLHYPRVSVPWQGMTSVKNRDPLRWDEVSSHSASRDRLVSSVTISRGAWLVHRSHACLELSPPPFSILIALYLALLRFFDTDKSVNCPARFDGNVVSLRRFLSFLFSFLFFS